MPQMFKSDAVDFLFFVCFVFFPPVSYKNTDYPVIIHLENKWVFFLVLVLYLSR